MVSSHATKLKEQGASIMEHAMKEDRHEANATTQNGIGRLNHTTPEISVITGDYFQYLLPSDTRGMEIEAIAHALANTCRFCGHVEEFYSVAQHSVIVSYLTPMHPFTGLMHDASEAYLTDVPRPIKPYIQGYKTLEDEIMSRLAAFYGFRHPLPEDVKHADMQVLITEGRDLTAAGRDGSWRQWDVPANPLPSVMPEPLEPTEAKKLFLRRYHELAGV